MKLCSLKPLKSMPLTALLEYVLMFLVLFYSSIWALFTSANCNTALRLAIPLLCLLIVLRLQQQPIPGMRWKRLVLLAVFLTVYLLFTRYNAVRYVLYYLLPLLLLTLYLGLMDERDACMGLLYKLSDIVLVLAVISLVCFTLGTVLGVLPGRQEVTYYWAEKTRTCGTYFHLYYESQKIVFLGREMVRNCGPFTEAPGFAIFLVYATAVETLLRDKLRPVRCTILTLAALTTFSAKAILLVVLAFGLRYVVVERRTIAARRLRMLLLPAVALLMAAAAVVLIGDKMTSHSFYIRMDDLFACVKTWLTAPLFGTGYWNDKSIAPFFTYPDRYDDGLSMGFALLLAEGGLYLLLFYILCAVFCLRRFRGESRRRMIAFFITYAGLLFITNMPYSFLAMFLLALSLEVQRHKPLSHTAAQ